MTDAATHSTPARVATLRAELRNDTAFVATPTPRLSWTVETDERGWRQALAEVRAGDESVRLETGDSVLVAWPFAPLAPGEAREVRVRVVATSGTADRLERPDRRRRGVPRRGRLGGRADRTRRRCAPGAARARAHRRSRSTRPVRRATLYYTALGVAEPELNGARVDDDVLAPGWTSYRDRLVHETVDVTALVREGDNVLGATIAGAWYTEKYGFFQFAERVYGDQPRLLAQLHLEYADGRTRDRRHGRRLAGVRRRSARRQRHLRGRARRPAPCGSTRRLVDPGFDASSWPVARRGASAREGYEHVPMPEARIAPPVRRIDELTVADVITSPSGADDPRLRPEPRRPPAHPRRRPRGHPPHAPPRRGARGRRALAAPSPQRRRDRRARARGDGEVTWEPRFTFHGFRYATIEGWPGEFDPADVTAVVLASDLPRTGWFDVLARAARPPA